MTRKKVESIAPESRVLNVKMKTGESHDHLVARITAGPHLAAASTIIRYGKAEVGEIPITEMMQALTEQSDALKNGDLSNIEAMLSSQAVALNLVFAELARRAAFNMGEYLDSAEIYLKLALRAQSQCRATLETLATIKNPPVVIARQANIAHGPQQVNNEAAPIARAEAIESKPNELLEDDHGERLDTRTTGKASRSDPAMAAVELIHRSKDRTRQGNRQL